MKQVRAFDPSKAGNVRGYCLRNVRLGYGIAPKYDSAWIAWQNTDQHTNAIPTGVDVPVYFWWGKYGHIGVRLANGTFWTDGKVYSSLTRYRLLHPAVVYRGWSTKVNDVTVIKYEAPTPPKFKMPKVGSKVQLIPKDKRSTFKAGTTKVAGTINVKDNTYVYLVRGYDKKYPNRILINSASAGGNGVALSLYYFSGQRIKGWVQI